MGIHDGTTIDRAVHLYAKVVAENLQEKRARRLEKELAPQRTESLFPQDKISLSSHAPADGRNAVKVTTKYHLGSVQRKNIIDIYV